MPRRDSRKCTWADGREGEVARGLAASGCNIPRSDERKPMRKRGIYPLGIVPSYGVAGRFGARYNKKPIWRTATSIKCVIPMKEIAKAIIIPTISAPG